MTLDELRPHLHTLPDQPDLVPYRTSYYQRDVGLLPEPAPARCAPRRRVRRRHRLDARGRSAHLRRVVVPGRANGEILISAHVCHPSLANDNLSGIAVSRCSPAELLAGDRRRATRSASCTRRARSAPSPGSPATRTRRSGSRHGLTLTCLGDDHPFTYKRTVGGDAAIDRAAAHVLARSGGRPRR